ncbi:MAG TPA: hypothetical protein VFN56_03485 [Candidatus Saccharimonadales bacterium]|nr:hypothetical protein [Candidatus Saccharimonadales bacterium]
MKGMTGELEPQPRIEEVLLSVLGRTDCIDKPVPGEGVPVFGRNFLDAYGTSPKRQSTENLIYEFTHMTPNDPDYDATKTFIVRFIDGVFGPLET